jgi:hypothetical protein
MPSEALPPLAESVQARSDRALCVGCRLSLARWLSFGRAVIGVAHRRFDLSLTVPCDREQDLIVYILAQLRHASGKGPIR